MSSSVFDSAHHGEHTFEMRRKASFSKLDVQKALRPMAGAYSDGGKEGDPPLRHQITRLFSLMSSYTATDTKTIQQRIVNHIVRENCIRSC